MPRLFLARRPPSPVLLRSPAASESFTVTVNGTAHNVVLSAATVATYNSTNHTSLNAASLSATDVATLINSQVGSPIATITNGALTFASTTTGPTSSIALSNVTLAGTASGSTASLRRPPPTVRPP